MATNSHLPFRGANRRAALVLASLAGALASVALLGAGLDASYGTQGTVARVQATGRATVHAAFPRQSYRPGEVARLVLFGKAPRSSVRVFRAGTERSRISPRDLMLGTAVSAPITVAAGARSASIRIGAWPSGLYFARVVAAGGRIGFAPFVLRPSRLGEHNVAIVLPTLTWQAYNFRDDDADGDSDSWYAQGTTARLGRPFENRGVPPHYKYYDQPFLRWLIQSDRDVDYLAQSDLETATGPKLASAYSAIVFPGHHEYVTEREYDAIETYRDRGGNLMFLSANNFFYKVARRGGLMHRVDKWRDLGRPEAALIGVQYIGNDNGERRGAWIVRNAGSGHWIFAETGARPGAPFSNAGIEIDHTASSSPRGTRVLAEIPNLLGPGMTAQMTYYETNAGAKVFAAGAFSLAGSIRQRAVARLIENLWDRLGRERPGDRVLAGVAQVGASAAVRPEERLRLPDPLPRRDVVVPILMYHRINVAGPSTPAVSRGLTVNPADFARQMSWLKRRGYRTVTQRELFEALFRGRPLGRRPILITFDDGYRDVFFKASPVLSRHGFRATAYVVSGRISNGDPSFLTWPMLRALERRGIEIGSHTMLHRDLTQLSTSRALADLVTSRRMLEQALGHPVQWLAYPFGRYDGRVEELARRAGYVLATTTRPGVRQSAAAPLALRRLRVLDSTGVRGLAQLLAAAER